MLACFVMIVAKRFIFTNTKPHTKSKYSKHSIEMFKFQFFYQKSFQLELFAKVSGIYPSSFTNVCFWTKIEILNVVKCRYGSQGAVSYATSSWQSHGGGSGVKPLKDLDLFTFVGHINSLKLKESSKLIFFESKLNTDMF